MYTVDLYLRVRLACHVDGLSQREAASRFGIARETVRKMLRHSEPPGYRRRQPPKRPKLAPFTDIIDRILEEDRPVHRKQHHTAKRIFERLRDEHGFTGKETIVKDYVRERRLRRREMFVPLSHPPGHAQADFGEADAIIAGVKYRAHFFVMTLSHSDACFVAAYRSRPPIGVRRHGQANQEERTSVRGTRVEGNRGGIGGVCDVLCQRKRKRGRFQCRRRCVPSRFNRESGEDEDGGRAV